MHVNTKRFRVTYIDGELAVVRDMAAKHHFHMVRLANLPDQRTAMMMTEAAYDRAVYSVICNIPPLDDMSE